MTDRLTLNFFSDELKQMSTSRFIRFFSRRRHQVKSQDSTIIFGNEKFFADVRLTNGKEKSTTIQRTFVCTVVFLDGEKVNFEVDVSRKREKFSKRNVFFRFRKNRSEKFYTKKSTLFSNSSKSIISLYNLSTIEMSKWVEQTRFFFQVFLFVQQWLDPTKPIKKQCQSRKNFDERFLFSKFSLFIVLVGPPFTFRFRVKFYSTDPQNLHEELTRWRKTPSEFSSYFRIFSSFSVIFLFFNFGTTFEREN